MGKKAVQPRTFRTDIFNREEYANGKGEGMIRAPSSGAATSLNETELESGREKELVQERPVPLKLDRAKACKIKKAQISSRTVQRRVHWPVIIHTSAPKVIRTDPSNFMWLVQNLTGSSITRSRCKKRRPQGGADDLMHGQTETLVECATTEALELELFLAETIISETSSDEEYSVTIQSTLEEAVSGFPEFPNAPPVEDDASPRGPLPPFDWLYPSVAPDESNFTTSLASSFQFSRYPDSQDIIATPLTVPFLEPICDSFPGDASFNSLSDLLLLSPSRLDGFTS